MIIGALTTKAAEVTVKETTKAIKRLIEGWAYFNSHEVVVGVTEEKSSRKGGKINNAELLYLQSNGIPSHNVPPRPVLIPAITKKETQEQIKTLMRDAAEQALVFGNKDACSMNFEKAGMVARDACKKYILDGIEPPNAASTIAAKRRKAEKSKKRPLTADEEKFLPLIDTGDLLNSITYAVRKK